MNEDAFRTQLMEMANQLLKEQMLIVLFKRLIGEDGGQMVFTVAEVDATGQYLLDMEIDQNAQTFTFTLKKKN